MLLACLMVGECLVVREDTPGGELGEPVEIGEEKGMWGLPPNYVRDTIPLHKHKNQWKSVNYIFLAASFTDV